MDNKQLSENLKYIKSAMYDSNKSVDPGAWMVVNFGIMCSVGYIGTHFLISNKLYKWINPLWLGLYAIALSVYILLAFILSKREKSQGIISHTTKQIGLVWWIIATQGIILGNFGLGRNFITDIGFMWAWLFSIAMCMMGIIYTKEWIIGGLGIFASIILARYMQSYPYIILGTATGFFSIIPAIVTRRRLRKLETVNE